MLRDHGKLLHAVMILLDNADYGKLSRDEMGSMSQNTRGDKLLPAELMSLGTLMSAAAILVKICVWVPHFGDIVVQHETRNKPTKYEVCLEAILPH